MFNYLLYYNQYGGNIMYICKRCKLLLMIIDERIISTSRAQLSITGAYVKQTVDSIDTISICPSCYGIGKPSIHVSDMDETLKEIETGAEKIVELYKLWTTLFRNLNNAEQDACYGIPLENKELREILLEELI